MNPAATPATIPPVPSRPVRECIDLDRRPERANFDIKTVNPISSRSSYSRDMYPRFTAECPRALLTAETHRYAHVVAAPRRCRRRVPTGTENIIQRARGRVALLECTRGLVPVLASIVPRGSRQAKELANMFVGCPNIRPVCAGSAPRLAASSSPRRYGNFIRPSVIPLISTRLLESLLRLSPRGREF